MNDTIMLGGIPLRLFLDALHVLVHAEELQLDKVLKPKAGMTERQRQTLNCIIDRIVEHRERLQASDIDEETYDNYGLKGEDRTPAVALLLSFENAVKAAQQQQAANMVQNMKPEDLN